MHNDRWVLCLVLLAGCGEAVDGDYLGEVEGSVIGGSPIPVTDRVVQMATVDCGGVVEHCTGTFITNEWILSAAHRGYACSEPRVTVAYWNGQILPAARIVNHPTGVDLALIRLQQPAAINGSTSGFRARCTPGAPIG